MERRIFVYRPNRGVLPLEEAGPRGDELTPNKGVITDTLDKPLRHPCDDKLYDSKSAFREATRINGCYEVGNDLLGKHRDKNTRPQNEVFPKEKIYRDLWNKL